MKIGVRDIEREKSRRNFCKRLWRGRILYLMILPPIITVFIFHYIPLYGVQIAFKNYKTSLGIWGSKWVGFKYFIKFFDYVMDQYTFACIVSDSDYFCTDVK